jgi:hypothetical protein
MLGGVDRIEELGIAPGCRHLLDDGILWPRRGARKRRRTGMESVSEMVVKVSILNIRIAEVPTTLSPHGRSHPPHLRSWRDGWRDLRFLLLFSPRWLFLYPGFAALVLGLLGTLWLLQESRTVGGITFDVHALLYFAILMFVGCQSVTFWIFAKIYGEREGVVPPDPWFHQAIKIISVERGLIAGAFLLVVGMALGLAAVGFWTTRGFRTLAPSDTMRYVIPSATMILLGFHVFSRLSSSVSWTSVPPSRGPVRDTQSGDRCAASPSAR